jgi:hypothetical protein
LGRDISRCRADVDVRGQSFPLETVEERLDALQRDAAHAALELVRNGAATERTVQLLLSSMYEPIVHRETSLWLDRWRSRLGSAPVVSLAVRRLDAAVMKRR